MLEAAEPGISLKPTPKAARLPRETLSAKLGASGYALYQEFLESIYDAVLITDWQGHILDGNARAGEFLRYEVRELCGLAIADIVYGLDEAVLQQIGGNLEHEQFTLIEEAYCRRKDQSLFPAEIATHKLHLGAEKHLCFFIRDITLRKQNEELLQQTRDRLVQAERLEMAGSIAGHIAHDFNNLLTPLVAYPDLIRGKLPEDSALHADLEVISKAAKQIAAINQQLLALALRGYQAQSVLNINSVIKLTVELLAYSAGAKRIKIDLTLAEDLFNLKGSPEQLQRVIQNLCLNGIEAMDLGGTLTIKTENVYLDTPLKKHELVPPGEYIKVTIGDTGHGIPRKNINQIFDPFFTTRPANQRRGAGLGLSVVRGIVKDHHGFIDLESAVGVGTVFNLYFSICRDEPEPAEPEKNYLGTETILVVDDDKLQIEVMTRLLQKAGYTVAGALSGEEALQLFNAYKPNARFPNLVILDMIMGNSMDGAQTYQELKAINPRQKAIILSGYAESPRVTLAQSLGAGAYVRKPVTLEKLGKAVRQELDRT
ncbi:MAG: response regulator [Lentisphaerae bacterium]|nr:response regulator [Lentisphaerota bacterium]